MIISFFEEYPTPQNLQRLNLIKFPTKLYLAAPSLKEFLKIKSKIKNKNIKEIVYWPVLKKEEGYWISPFSQRKALLRIFHELQGKNVPVMIDAEFPLTRNPSLVLTQFFNFFRNRSLIRNFVKTYPDMYVAEYYPSGKIQELILSFLGVHFDPQIYRNNIIRMMYHSMHNFNHDFFVTELTRGKKEFGNKFLVAYGTIAKGVTKRELLLSSKQLTTDLRIAKKYKLNEVVIFRLGGLSTKYLKAIKNSLTK